MEERIIDDEYGRGIRLKKTADGFVDVTDELAAEQGEEEQADEVSFEFPMMEFHFLGHLFFFARKK